ncbi:DNA adenine methylase [Xenorhabdus cabanillasii]|uniref:D12 class N6 adenine-specific DNA methyltransferase n=1 Tax=Xenorhabdus cabanillasii JM26 TaxID=1427517 RepID=W1J9I4_9GAMM|nr:DNA adenine methylase [Xenorhabdus cabanillasii]PHM75312.1 DNA adenine methylase [Xenorhabdus cabanillasii JM26]CDL86683.1 D12 class N6 adenine-specific DNA methyltransferase [Xenorhabdus cabanillasii JM26]
MKNFEPVSPPVTWFGSKSRLVKKIVKYFPEHQTYVDVFGGSGAVLLGKRPSKVEVYNDLNKKMTSLFNVLSDKRKTQELIRRLELTPYSRDMFKSAAVSIDNETDEIELAKLMIVIQRQSHGGLAKQWSYCVDAPAGGYSASVRKFHAGIERLPNVQARMRKVQIENLCFTDLIPRYDRPGTLFYLDPPYVPDTRINGKYENEMTLDDHHALIDLLLKSSGMFVLSGYQTPVYQPLESAGWKRVDIETYASTSKTRTKRTECLWISPNCMIKNHIPEYRDIDKNSDLTNRQKTALRVHRHRREQSESVIKEAIYSLKRMKKKVTKVGVSRMTGISREHITRHYGHLF